MLQHPPWTKREDETLIAFLRSGTPSPEIAREMKRSRSSVMGRKKRLGLCIPKEAIKKKKAKPSSYFSKFANVEHTPVFPSQDRCQFPIGDVGSKKFKFCAKPVLEGRIYCSKCCAIAYRNWSEVHGESRTV